MFEGYKVVYIRAYSDQSTPTQTLNPTGLLLKFQPWNEPERLHKSSDIRLIELAKESIYRYWFPEHHPNP
jgi:hypothetical protein